MINRQQFSGIVHFAVAVVVIADGAVEHVIAQNPVECLYLRRSSFGGIGRDLHSCGGACRAGAHKLAIDFDHTGITGLNGPELRVIADVRQLLAGAADHIDQQLTILRGARLMINDEFNHVASSGRIACKLDSEPWRSRRFAVRNQGNRSGAAFESGNSAKINSSGPGRLFLHPWSKPAFLNREAYQPPLDAELSKW